MSVIELSSGHVFAKGSVQAVGPLTNSLKGNLRAFEFKVIGVGFVVEIEYAWIAQWKKYEKFHGIAEFDADAIALRQEAIDKLLAGVEA